MAVLATSQPALPRSRYRALRVLWWRRIRPVWHDLRPLVLAGAIVAVLVLGTIGFQQYMRNHGHEPTAIDSFYRTLTLFELDGVDVEPPIPLAMEIARFLAPVLLGYAVFRGIVAVFRQQLQLVGIRLLMRNHVVIAGLGEMGFRLAAAFHDVGFRVIAIEIDEANGSIQGVRERGISVLAGDARDRRMLAKARVGHARYLVAVCGDDGRNVEVEVAAGELATHRASGALHVLAHLDDSGLWRMLKAESIAHQSPGVRREFFNVHQAAARILLAERPPFPTVAQDERPLRRPHVLVAGLEGIGTALVLLIAR